MFLSINCNMLMIYQASKLNLLKIGPLSSKIKNNFKSWHFKNSLRFWLWNSYFPIFQVVVSLHCAKRHSAGRSNRMQMDRKERTINQHILGNEVEFGSLPMYHCDKWYKIDCFYFILIFEFAAHCVERHSASQDSRMQMDHKERTINQHILSNEVEFRSLTL